MDPSEVPLNDTLPQLQGRMGALQRAPRSPVLSTDSSRASSRGDTAVGVSYAVPSTAMDATPNIAEYVDDSMMPSSERPTGPQRYNARGEPVQIPFAADPMMMTAVPLGTPSTTAAAGQVTYQATPASSQQPRTPSVMPSVDGGWGSHMAPSRQSKMVSPTADANPVENVTSVSKHDLPDPEEGVPVCSLPNLSSTLQSRASLQQTRKASSHVSNPLPGSSHTVTPQREDPLLTSLCSDDSRPSSRRPDSTHSGKTPRIPDPLIGATSEPNSWLTKTRVADLRAASDIALSTPPFTVSTANVNQTPPRPPVSPVDEIKTLQEHRVSTQTSSGDRLRNPLQLTLRATTARPLIAEEEPETEEGDLSPPRVRRLTTPRQANHDSVEIRAKSPVSENTQVANGRPTSTHTGADRPIKSPRVTSPLPSMPRSISPPTASVVPLSGRINSPFSDTPPPPSGGTATTSAMKNRSANTQAVGARDAGTEPLGSSSPPSAYLASARRVSESAELHSTWEIPPEERTVEIEEDASWAAGIEERLQEVSHASSTVGINVRGKMDGSLVSAEEVSPPVSRSVSRPASRQAGSHATSQRRDRDAKDRGETRPRSPQTVGTKKSEFLYAAIPATAKDALVAAPTSVREGYLQSPNAGARLRSEMENSLVRPGMQVPGRREVPLRPESAQPLARPPSYSVVGTLAQSVRQPMGAQRRSFASPEEEAAAMDARKRRSTAASFSATPRSRPRKATIGGVVPPRILVQDALQEPVEELHAIWEVLPEERTMDVELLTAELEVVEEEVAVPEKVVEASWAADAEERLRESSQASSMTGINVRGDMEGSLISAEMEVPGSPSLGGSRPPSRRATSAAPGCAEKAAADKTLLEALPLATKGADVPSPTAASGKKYESTARSETAATNSVIPPVPEQTFSPLSTEPSVAEPRHVAADPSLGTQAVSTNFDVTVPSLHASWTLSSTNFSLRAESEMSRVPEEVQLSTASQLSAGAGLRGLGEMESSLHSLQVEEPTRNALQSATELADQPSKPSEPPVGPAPAEVESVKADEVPAVVKDNEAEPELEPFAEASERTEVVGPTDAPEEPAATDVEAKTPAPEADAAAAEVKNPQKEAIEREAAEVPTEDGTSTSEKVAKAAKVAEVAAEGRIAQEEAAKLPATGSTAAPEVRIAPAEDAAAASKKGAETRTEAERGTPAPEATEAIAPPEPLVEAVETETETLTPEETRYAPAETETETITSEAEEDVEALEPEFKEAPADEAADPPATEEEAELEVPAKVVESPVNNEASASEEPGTPAEEVAEVEAAKPESVKPVAEPEEPADAVEANTMPTPPSPASAELPITSADVVKDMRSSPITEARAAPGEVTLLREMSEDQASWQIHPAEEPKKEEIKTAAPAAEMAAPSSPPAKATPKEAMEAVEEPTEVPAEEPSPASPSTAAVVKDAEKTTPAPTMTVMPTKPPQPPANDAAVSAATTARAAGTAVAMTDEMVLQRLFRCCLPRGAPTATLVVTPSAWMEMLLALRNDGCHKLPPQPVLEDVTQMMRTAARLRGREEGISLDDFKRVLQRELEEVRRDLLPINASGTAAALAAAMKNSQVGFPRRPNYLFTAQAGRGGSGGKVGWRTLPTMAMTLAGLYPVEMASSCPVAVVEYLRSVGLMTAVMEALIQRLQLAVEAMPDAPASASETSPSAGAVSGEVLPRTEVDLAGAAQQRGSLTSMKRLREEGENYVEPQDSWAEQPEWLAGSGGAAQTVTAHRPTPLKVAREARSPLSPSRTQQQQQLSSPTQSRHQPSQPLSRERHPEQLMNLSTSRYMEQRPLDQISASIIARAKARRVMDTLRRTAVPINRYECFARVEQEDERVQEPLCFVSEAELQATFSEGDDDGAGSVDSDGMQNMMDTLTYDPAVAARALALGAAAPRPSGAGAPIGGSRSGNNGGQPWRMSASALASRVFAPPSRVAAAMTQGRAVTTNPSGHTGPVTSSATSGLTGAFGSSQRAGGAGRFVAPRLPPPSPGMFSMSGVLMDKLDPTQEVALVDRLSKPALDPRTVGLRASPMMKLPTMGAGFPQKTDMTASQGSMPSLSRSGRRQVAPGAKKNFGQHTSPQQGGSTQPTPGTSASRLPPLSSRASETSFSSTPRDANLSGSRLMRHATATRVAAAAAMQTSLRSSPWLPRVGEVMQRSSPSQTMSVAHVGSLTASHSSFPMLGAAVAMPVQRSDRTGTPMSSATPTRPTASARLSGSRGSGHRRRAPSDRVGGARKAAQSGPLRSSQRVSTPNNVGQAAMAFHRGASAHDSTGHSSAAMADEVHQFAEDPNAAPLMSNYEKHLLRQLQSAYTIEQQLGY